MAIGESAGILFKIKADGSQAKREINEVEGAIKGSASGIGSSLTSMVNPAALAAAGIAAIGTAAVAAVTGLFRLTASAAEYGSEIFDASQKTGLGAASLSALRHAAETSGSSFEGVTGAVSKFNVLLGEAALGNEKATATLAKFGVTATDVDTALSQAITTIAKETDVTKQAAAAKALFKDRTAEILPVIKSFDGDLPGLIDKLTKLGLAMTDTIGQFGKQI